MMPGTDLLDPNALCDNAGGFTSLRVKPSLFNNRSKRQRVDATPRSEAEGVRRLGQYPQRRLDADRYRLHTLAGHRPASDWTILRA
jgi:hypothetical protein